MKAFKIIEYIGDNQYVKNIFTKGRLFVELDNGYYLLAATPKEGQHRGYSHRTLQLVKTEEVDLLKEIWVHPHLLKAIKEQVKINLESSK